MGCFASTPDDGAAEAVESNEFVVECVHDTSTDRKPASEITVTKDSTIADAKVVY